MNAGEVQDVVSSPESLSTDDLRLPLPVDIDFAKEEEASDARPDSLSGDSDHLIPEEDFGQQFRQNIDRRVDEKDLEGTIREAVLSTPPVMNDKLPWELPGMDLVFGDEPEDFRMPVPRLEPSLYINPSRSQESYTKSVRTNTKYCPQAFLRSIDFDANDMTEWHLNEVKWRKAVEKWYKILLVSPDARPDGLVFVEDQLEQNIERVRELFGTRSLATVTKRADSMLAYIRWFDGIHYFDRALPLSRRHVEDYVEHLRNSHAAASTAESFLEAVNFGTHVIGLKSATSHESLISTRSKTLSDMALQERKELRQARPLTVKEVESLEHFLNNPDLDATDRFAAGAFLFCLFGRCRWSDIRHVYAFQLDVVENQGLVKGYIELRTRNHKTARLVARKGVALPLVAPVWGLCSPPWALTFVKVAQLVGLELSAEFKGPLLPAPNADGTWSSRSVGSREATRWLNMLLDLPEDETAVSSHSLKATLLAWCAKCGVDKTDRLILGHHSTGSKSLETYSRDLLSHPLRSLDQVLHQVRIKAFMPDATRSGQMQEPQTEDVAHEPVNGNRDISEELPEEQETEDQNSSSTSSSSSESSGEQPPHEESRSSFDLDYQLFQHRRSRIVHRKADGSTTDEFVCGTKNAESFKKVAETDLVQSRLCKRCALCKPIRNLGTFAQALKKQRLQQDHV